MIQKTDELPRVELPSEGQDNYLEYVIERIQEEFEKTDAESATFETEATLDPDTQAYKAFGIDLLAFKDRQQEVDLIVRLRDLGYEAKLYSRPGKTTVPYLFWFTVQRIKE